MFARPMTAALYLVLGGCTLDRLHCSAGKSNILISNEYRKVSFLCTFKERATTMRWFFKPKESQNEITIYDNKMNPTEGFHGDCDGDKMFCNLEINKAMRSMAGKYKLVYGMLGEGWKSGCAYELVIGELECKSGLRNNNLVVGSSDCQVLPEKIKRSCSFHHWGEFNGPARFVWLVKRSEEKLTRHRILNQTSNEDGKILRADDEFEVTNDLDGTALQCSLEGARDVEPCQLPKISVEYAKSPKENSLSVDSKNFEAVDCLVDKSKHLECSQHWQFRLDDVEIKIQADDLRWDLVLVPGEYRCFASCRFVTGEKCLVPGVKVVSTSGHCGKQPVAYMIAVVILCLMTASLILLSLYFYKQLRLKSSGAPVDTEDKHI